MNDTINKPLEMKDFEFEKLDSDRLGYEIFNIRATSDKDTLFYALVDVILKEWHNTQPETLIRIANDTEYKNHYKKEVLAAQLLLTYFE